MGEQGKFECDHCHINFKDKYNLTRHQVSMDKAYPTLEAYSCAQCDKTFSRADNLKAHLKRHQTVQQFSCSDCAKKYASKSKLNLHAAKAHEDGEILTFQCSHCEFESESKWNLGQHMQRHTGKEAYSCDDCRYKTSTKHNLNTHVQVKHGPRPRREFPCNQCDYSTPLKSRSFTHRQKHTDVRAFSCRYCEQTFKNKHQLPIHLRIHSGEGLLKCEPCDKDFTTKQLMKKHRTSVSHRLDPEQQLQRLQLLQKLKVFAAKMKRLRAEEYLVEISWMEGEEQKEMDGLIGSNSKLLFLLESFPVRHRDNNWKNREGMEQIFEPTLEQARSQDQAFNQALKIFHPDSCSAGWRQNHDPEGKYTAALDGVATELTGRKLYLKYYCEMLRQKGAAG